MTFPGAIGKKRGMTQVFDEDGSAVPVTVIELLPLTVTQVKTEATDGYTAVQVGYQESKKEKELSKPEQGHFKKNNLKLFRHLREFRLPPSEMAGYEVGQVIAPEFLTTIEKVNVIGRSIGKGFQGRIKLHNFSRGPMSHGSKSHRLPGSIGAGTTPGRVFKGLKMAAHMGDNRVTVENLRVFLADLENNILLIKGAVPGKPGATVFVQPRKVINAGKGA
jgi:large subunit ribosomal protein L3